MWGSRVVLNIVFAFLINVLLYSRNYLYYIVCLLVKLLLFLLLLGKYTNLITFMKILKNQCIKICQILYGIKQSIDLAESMDYKKSNTIF